MFDEFKKFVIRGKLVDMTVGIVIMVFGPRD
jgi:large-conductance mechanosensitive channel